MNLVERNWELLVVMDACRYDYFKMNYKDFLDGELSKRTSPACRTPEWFDEEFGDQEHDDIVYVSANPHINSVTSSEGIRASENFHEVVDVWKTGWSNDKNTVLPEAVRDEALEALEEYENKRVVAHYIQPHYPYLGKKVDGLGWFREDDEYSLLQKMYRFASFRLIGNCLNTVMGRARAWKIRNVLGLPTSDGKDELVWREFKNNVAEWKRLYEDNLRQGLETVEELAESTDRRMAVTADHGEAFGEQGVFLHPPDANINELRHVPYLEVQT